jgi:hypothetical protein
MHAGASAIVVIRATDANPYACLSRSSIFLSKVLAKAAFFLVLALRFLVRIHILVFAL